MALIIPEGYAHVIHSLNMLGDPEPFAITYGVEVAPGGLPTPASLASDLSGELQANVIPAMNDQLTLVNTEVTYQETAPPDPPLVGAFAVNDQGGNGSYALVPQNTAFLVHKRTASGGRTGRGRLYLPGVGESDVNNLGQVAGASLSAWNGIFAAWLADINALADVVGMVILHSSGGAGAALPPYEVTSIYMDPVIATQRRRLRR